MLQLRIKTSVAAHVHAHMHTQPLGMHHSSSHGARTENEGLSDAEGHGDEVFEVLLVHKSARVRCVTGFSIHIRAVIVVSMTTLFNLGVGQF
jgi:hypothetical protein